MNPRGNEKFLIIQYRPVGDILLTAPVAETIKTIYPDAKVVFLVERPYYPVLKNNPYIDDVILSEKIEPVDFKTGIEYALNKLNVLKKVRRQKFDVVLDYIGLPSSAILTFLSGAAIRAGYGDLRLRGRLYNRRAGHIREKKYTVLKKYGLLEAAGIRAEDPVTRTRIYTGTDDRKRTEKFFKDNGLNGRFNVIFSPGSPREYKKWPGRCYAELGRQLVRSYGAAVLLLHGPGEKKECMEIAAGIGRGAFILPDTTILQAAAFIEKASLVVLNCGGMKHISVAAGTSSVTIFGKTSPATWHPPGLGWAVFVDGIYDGKDSSFGVTAGTVIEKILELDKNGFISLPAGKTGS